DAVDLIRRERRLEEHVEPLTQAGFALDRRRPVEESGAGCCEAVLLEQGRVLTNAREVPGIEAGSFDNGTDIPLPAKLSDESAAALERLPNGCDGIIRRLDPVQRRVRKDCIEAFGPTKAARVGEAEFQLGIVLARLSDHLGRAVDAD